MTDERPPLLTGGARRSRIRPGRRRRRGSRSRDRRPRFSRILFLVPLVGGIALAAILLGSSGSDDGSHGGQAQVRPEGLAQPAKPPVPAEEPAAGGGDSRFAVKLS